MRDRVDVVASQSSPTPRSPSRPRIVEWQLDHGPVVGPLLTRAGGRGRPWPPTTPPESWNEHYRDFIAGVTAGDFVLSPDDTAYPIGASLDLVAVLDLP